MKPAVVVLGATCSVGRAVVQTAIADGRPVIAVSPDASGLANLHALHAGDDLTPIVGSTLDDPSASQLASRLRELDRPLAGVIVSSCGEPVRGRMLDQSSDKLRRTLNEELLPQLIAARELVPLLVHAGRSGSYVVIGGPGSDRPWAGYGHRSVAAGATRMLLRVLHDEARTLGVRVQLLSVDMPARTEDNAQRACSQWPSAAAIAERALALVDQTDTRVPAEAIVQFDAAAVRAPPPRPARVPPREPDDPSPLPSLDDTWALLKPFLSNNSKKESTS